MTEERPSVEHLLGMFNLRDDGSLVWRIRPKYHPRMLGRDAGGPRLRPSGKHYWYVRTGSGRLLRSHIVFCITRGRWPSLQIDHINGDSLCDRPDNLREATATQNAWNHKKRAKRSSLPMGVRQAKSGRYVARISVNKRHITIGTFNTIKIARDEYLLARKLFFGAFA